MLAEQSHQQQRLSYNKRQTASFVNWHKADGAEHLSEVSWIQLRKGSCLSPSRARNVRLCSLLCFVFSIYNFGFLFCLTHTRTYTRNLHKQTQKAIVCLMLIVREHSSMQVMRFAKSVVGCLPSFHIYIYITHAHMYTLFSSAWESTKTKQLYFISLWSLRFTFDRINFF